MTAEEPASVAFEMKLIGIDTGVVLWSAKYDEVQKSALENLYDWGKSRSRGFTWITAEELMKEGIQEKFGVSPYFKPVKENDSGQNFPADDQI